VYKGDRIYMRIFGGEIPGKETTSKTDIGIYLYKVRRKWENNVS
jgi:hypothetical protein